MSQGRRVEASQLPPGAQFSTKIPSNLRKVVLGATDLSGKTRLNGVTQGDGHWSIAVNQGSGAGSKTQSFVLLTSGKIIDKTPVEVEPKHTGSNSDL